MPRSVIELVAALVATAVAVAGIVEASGYRGASSYMPLAVTGIAAVLGLVWAGQSAFALARGAGGTMQFPAALVGRFIIIVAAAVAYVYGIAHIGYFTSTIIMVPVLSTAIGYRNFVVTVLATIGFCAVLYAVFRLLLSVPLPPEAILNLLGA
ncbi:tripartite tricarboxylate transporter TctB family protein [Acuticoccus sp. M5D2P5]|uniref:tripartite tricarboxylate transporter TctB family protein n=1 Tax=Acuticoccus kalidii TaxID=2910977 RepID=UPI001F1AD2F1|nr:tripartite tricarboxylate transporter TctB family protein [Acuticoccus kalidii]MCF3933831.1 tripartite tricarboxylate transporter TctB family protein [Acuticoccus kalidii]